MYEFAGVGVRPCALCIVVVMPPLILDPVDVDLAVRHVALHAVSSGVFRQDHAVFRDDAVAAEDHVGGRFGSAGGGVDISA